MADACITATRTLTPTRLKEIVEEATRAALARAGVDAPEVSAEDGASLFESSIEDLGGVVPTRRRTMHAYGPYTERLRTTVRFKVVVKEHGKKNRSLYFPTEDEAKKEARRINRAAALADAIRVGEAIDEYAEYLNEKRLRPRTVERTTERLRAFFGAKLETPVVALKEDDGQRLYDTFRRRPKANGQPMADASQLNALNEAKTFLRWCVRRKFAKAAILDPVEGIGKRNEGKAQLTTDEAARFAAQATELADQGDVGAIAALTALYHGTRAGEVVARTARDLDAGGTLIHIPDAKTRAGVRRLQVAEPLRPYLLRLAQGKEPGALLFAGRAPAVIKGRRRGKAITDLSDPVQWLRRQVRAVCKLAGVPVVCSHGLRGTHASIAQEAGATAHLLTTALGHTSFAITKAAYVRRDALSNATTARVAQALAVVETGNQNSVSTALSAASAAA